MIAALLLAQLVAADRVALPGRTIRIADVVAGSRSTLPLAELPRAARSFVLSRRALAALITRRTGTRIAPGEGDIRFAAAVAVRQPAPYEPAAPSIARGAPLEVATAIGPVRIARAVTALEDGRAGRRLFVRDADGAVFSAAVPGKTR